MGVHRAVHPSSLAVVLYRTVQGTAIVGGPKRKQSKHPWLDAGHTHEPILSTDSLLIITSPGE